MKIKYTTLRLILVASQGSAHGAADNHLQIMVVDNRIKINIVVDMRVLDIADARGDRVDHARILQTVAFPNSVTGLEVDLGRLARLVPEVRVTIIDAATGLHYRLRDPRVAQTISLPT